MAIAFLRAMYGAAGMLRTFDNLSDLLSYRFEGGLIMYMWSSAASGAEMRSAEQ